VSSFASKRKTFTGTTRAADVDLTPIMCLFIILVPLLLLTAVFERLAALKVNLPRASTMEELDKPIEPSGIIELRVMIQEEGLAIEGTLSHDSSGKEMDIYQDIRYEIPMVGDEEYDFPKLQEIMKELKQEYPKHEEVVFLVDDKIPYDTIVQTMDTCREEFFLDEETGEKQKSPLFPSISLSESFTEDGVYEGIRGGTRKIDRELGYR